MAHPVHDASAMYISRLAAIGAITFAHATAYAQPEPAPTQPASPVTTAPAPVPTASPATPVDAPAPDASKPDEELDPFTFAGQWQLDNADRYISEAYGGYHFGDPTVASTSRPVSS